MKIFKALLVAFSIVGAGVATPHIVQRVQAQPAEVAEPPVAEDPLAAPVPRRATERRRVEDLDEQLLPKTAEGKTAVGMVFLAFMWFLWFVVQRLNKRSKAEGDLDQRLPLILANVTAGWEKLNEKQAAMIDKAEARADRATDEREALMKQFIDYTTIQAQAHAADLAKTREHFTESQRRLYERVEVFEQHHKDCARKLEETERRLSQLDQRQYNAALVATPVVPAAVAPAAVPLTVPPTGLTITPGMSSPGAHPAP